MLLGAVSALFDPLDEEKKRLSFSQLEQLVEIGRRVVRVRKERKNKRAHLKNLCDKFRKDLENYLQDEISYSQEEEICRGESTSEYLNSIGMNVTQAEQRQMSVKNTQIVFDLY